MNTETICRNAIRLWQMMNDGNTWNYRQLRQKSQLPDRDINAALGWLAREGKVAFEESAEDPKELIVSLVQDR